MSHYEFWLLFVTASVFAYGIVIQLGHIATTLETIEKDLTDLTVSGQRCDRACEEMRHNIQILANGVSSRYEKLGY